MPMYNPLHPGVFISETYLIPLNISISKAAAHLGVSYSTFYRLIKGKSDISPEMALRLSMAFGRTAHSWAMMQAYYDLWKAKKLTDFDSIGIKKVTERPSITFATTKEVNQATEKALTKYADAIKSLADR